MKSCLLCLLLGLMLCIAPAMAEEVPAAILDSLPNAVITASAHWDDPERTTWFVLAQEEGNTLYCFTVENNACTQLFSTSEALPQGSGRVAVHLSDSAWDFRNIQNDGGRYISGPILLVLQYGADDQSVERLLSFQRSEADTWNLIALRDYPQVAILQIDDDTVTYFKPADKAQSEIAGVAPRRFERELRSMNLAQIPLTLQQAQAMPELLPAE